MPTAVRCVFAATFLLLACGSTTPAAPFRQLDSTNGQAPGAFKSSVKEHALHGAVMRDALARGDLPAAHGAAHALVQLVLENERPAPHTPVGEMIDAARKVEAADDLRTATHAFALLADRCGACHGAFGGPRSFPAEPPAEKAGVAPRMRRHQWGAARLWEGLVAPSDEAWKTGAMVLAEAPLESEAVHELGAKGVSATSASARVAVYGELLSTCAGCHRMTGGGPEGPRP